MSENLNVELHNKEMYMLAKRMLFTLCFIFGVASCVSDEQSNRTIEQQVISSLVEMDLSSSPTHRDLIASGQLGGLAYSYRKSRFR